MSKLSFRPRALDAMKPMPIYMSEELPDLPDYSAINRAVPQIPSGMEKEEECEHHLQRAICTGLIIPTPEFLDVTDVDVYDAIYPTDCKMPRQLIHMQPFAMEQDIPEYDMDSEDERWVEAQSKKLDLTPLKFEEMMDRLEKASGQTVLKLQEAKILLKEDDDLIVAVYDYWLTKRLKNQHPLIPTVRTEHRPGSAANNPYLAFRRRTEKMQTRKVRKNDETSYEKMLKLRRELSRAVTLMELVKKREKTKRELLHLTVEIFEKRYQAEDFSGQLLAEVSALKPSRPAFAPIFPNQFGLNQNWANKVTNKDDLAPRRKSYKKRKHKGVNSPLLGRNGSDLPPGYDLGSSGEESEDQVSPTSLREEEEEEDLDSSEGPFAFRRKMFCNYHAPLPTLGNWPWTGPEDGGLGDKRFRYCLTSLSVPEKRCIGLARRRVGRGGRVILDRASSSVDDLFSSLDFTIFDSVNGENKTVNRENGRLHFRPKTPSPSPVSSEEDDASSFEGDISGSLFMEPMCDLFSTAEPVLDKEVPMDISETSPDRTVPDVQVNDTYERLDASAGVSFDEIERPCVRPFETDDLEDPVGCTRFMNISRRNLAEDHRIKRRRHRLHSRSPSPNSVTSPNFSMSSLSSLLTNSGAFSNIKTELNSELNVGASSTCNSTVVSNGPVLPDYPMVDEAGTLTTVAPANASYTMPMLPRGLGPPSNYPPSCSVLASSFQLRPSVATVSVADIKMEPDDVEDVTLSSSGEDVNRVCIEQKKQQLVRKNNSVPMEVT